MDQYNNGSHWMFTFLNNIVALLLYLEQSVAIRQENVSTTRERLYLKNGS